MSDERCSQAPAARVRMEGGRKERRRERDLRVLEWNESQCKRCCHSHVMSRRCVKNGAPCHMNRGVSENSCCTSCVSRLSGACGCQLTPALAIPWPTCLALHTWPGGSEQNRGLHKGPVQVKSGEADFPSIPRPVAYTTGISSLLARDYRARSIDCSQPANCAHLCQRRLTHLNHLLDSLLTQHYLHPAN